MKANILKKIFIPVCFIFLSGINLYAQCTVNFQGTGNIGNITIPPGGGTVSISFFPSGNCSNGFTLIPDVNDNSILWLSSFGITGNIVSCTVPLNTTGAARSTISPLMILGSFNEPPLGYVYVNQDYDETLGIWYKDSDGDGSGDQYSDEYGYPGEFDFGWSRNNNDLCPFIPGPIFNNGCPSGFIPENWNTVTTKGYDIAGNLKADSKSYYNALGKFVQSQSVDIKNNRIWANQTLYDNQGRPALTTLSAPIREVERITDPLTFAVKTNFLYKGDFIKTESGNTYSNSNFENTPENPSPVGTVQNTLGWYYSTLNTNSYADGNDYQDITDRPYFRTIYSELNPGAALKTIGGNKVDTDDDGDVDNNDTWLHGYTFSMPAGDELTQSVAFDDPSYKVTNNRKIIKTISKDVHNNEVVIFTDTDGKTLAAARTGAATSRTTTINVSTQGFVDVHVPIGTTGFTINTVSGITTEVYDLITEQTTSAATNTLSPGFYRISITNLDSYNPTTPATTVTINCKENYYDYSLNEYDEAGRLTASYQPVGATKAQKPVTTYSYNALGQLLSTTSPDEGTANFKYRKDGQIHFSQNSKQLDPNADGNTSDQEFSYTNYDDLGRPIESGAAAGVFSSLDSDAVTFAYTSKREQQFTVYDALDSSDLTFLNGVNSSYGTPSFLAGNVAKTSNDNTTTYYSYDVYGRVKWIVQNIPVLGAKTIDYEYDPVTSQVDRVIYQKNKTDQFIHRYSYDVIDNSLVKVETSTNGSAYITHADYKYYETGALKQIQLAPYSGTPLQNINYVYNLNGQLKAINPDNDPNDLFSMQIDYHNKDYNRTERSDIGTFNYGQNQFNGNIKGVRWKNKEIDNTEQTYSYHYNKNNWLTDAIYGQYNNTGGDGTTINIFDEDIYDGITKNFNATNSITWLPGFHAKPGSGQEVTAKIISGTPSTFQSGDYNVFDITYDANGNIRTLNRNKDTNGSSNSMDQLNYAYDPEKPNQLKRVDDAAGDVSGADDIGDQDGDNYKYNSIGQLEENVEEGIKCFYNTSGLVTEIKKNNVTLVKFFYNDKGHRVKKEAYTSGSLTKTEYYIRDAAGTALAIYEGITVKEHTIYGASRLGVYNKSDGSSYYQLTDHLGNVRVVTGRASNGTAMAIVANTDYYPFGMPMPNRNIEGNYRYKYQGQEKDPETGKEAFQLRLWDARIGRWLTTDPYGQYNSPYLGMGNDPINGIDPDGGLFGRIRAWIHKQFNGGSMHQRTDGKWAWQKGTGGVAALGDGDGDLTGVSLQYKNFGYGGLGKLEATSSTFAVSGEYNVGILNHGLDIGLIGLELNANTTLSSFSYGRQIKDGQWSPINESFDSNYRDKYAEKRTTVGASVETPFGDGSFNLKGVKLAGKGSKWQTAKEIKAGYAILGLQFHKLNSKGLDFGFSIQEDVGAQFFFGGSLDVNINTSYKWRF